MASHQRPSARRGPSGGHWSRLERFKSSAPTDALEAYGLPSKGETRLNDYKAQEAYYNKIVERYMRFCGDTGRNELENQFAALAITLRGGTLDDVGSAAAGGMPSLARQDAQTRKDPATELSICLSAMRKLREAIVATSRADTFAQRAYIFIIHAAILVRHYESYHPALLYLLKHIHPRTPLSVPELHEFVGYQILDLACRQNDLAGAHEVRIAQKYRDRRVEGVLRTLASDNWVRFWRLRRAVDGHQAKLMEATVEHMRLHVLKCLGRSYMTADRVYVEKSTSTSWEELVKKGVGWQLVEDTGTVIIRRPKTK